MIINSGNESSIPGKKNGEKKKTGEQLILKKKKKKDVVGISQTFTKIFIMTVYFGPVESKPNLLLVKLIGL